MDERTQKLIDTVFRGDVSAWRQSLPDRMTVEGANGWHTKDRRVAESEVQP